MSTQRQMVPSELSLAPTFGVGLDWDSCIVPWSKKDEEEPAIQLAGSGRVYQTRLGGLK